MNKWILSPLSHHPRLLWAFSAIRRVVLSPESILL